MVEINHYYTVTQYCGEEVVGTLVVPSKNPPEIVDIPRVDDRCDLVKIDNWTDYGGKKGYIVTQAGLYVFGEILLHKTENYEFKNRFTSLNCEGISGLWAVDREKYNEAMDQKEANMKKFGLDPNAVIIRDATENILADRFVQDGGEAYGNGGGQSL